MLKNLKSGTTYYFRVRSVDSSGNIAISEGHFFTTLALPDTIPPANVIDFKAESGDSEILLIWKNPDDIDFLKIRLERSDKDFVINPGDGILIYEGLLELFLDKNLINDQRYYYTIWAYDKSGNISSGALVSAVPFTKQTIPQELQDKKLESVTEVLTIKLPLDKLKLQEKIFKKFEDQFIKDISFFIDYGAIDLQIINNEIKILPNHNLIISIPANQFFKKLKLFIQYLIINYTF